jgi:hypothetical protein
LGSGKKKESRESGKAKKVGTLEKWEVDVTKKSGKQKAH